MKSKSLKTNNFFLKRIPIEQDFMRLYWELSKLGAPSVGKEVPWPYKFSNKEDLIALACDILRYDPRLLTILIIYFKDHWQEFNPFSLRCCIPHMISPQVFGILKEFILEGETNPELRYFWEYLIKGLKPVNPQLFFIGLHEIGSSKNVFIAEKSLKPYLKWGFLGIERPTINLTTRKTVGTFHINTRKKILLDLVQAKKEVTLKDYLFALDYTISRQQALYDLKHCKELRLKGCGRGARWILS